MKVFHCNHCQQLVFFESSQCVQCGRTLAYLPDMRVVASLEPADASTWISHASGAIQTYRLCANYSENNVCNWAIPEADANPLCQSCRLTRVMPDLSRPGFREAWYKLEVAKRRLIYTLEE